MIVESISDFAPAQIKLLKRYGFVTTVLGPTAVIQTTYDNALALENLPFVVDAEKPRRFTADLDQSVPDIGANTVWSGLKDADGRNVTGQDVLIGFVDTGIDVKHPDFTFADGTTRILYVWDQTQEGRHPDGFNYGYECTSSDIRSNRCPEKDTFGHGTHVAGIAASSGLATGKYIGVAPGAFIIFVKSGHEVCDGASWTFDSAQLLDGLSYIVNKAKQLGKRAVINLSLGGNIGAHDGTDPFERALDAIVRDGIPVVVAAGNSATDNAHVRGRLATGENTTIGFIVRQNTTDVAVDIWYSTKDQFDAVLTTPNGDAFRIPTPGGGGMSEYGNVTGIRGSADLGKELYFEVNSKENLPPEGWRITLSAISVNSQDHWDAWIDTVSCSFPGAYFTEGDRYSVDPQYTVGIPGTAENVVTVGAYVTKSSWLGMDDQTYGRPNIPVGNIAPFSSLGPTRDGRIKPDIVAPGMLIASARSSEVPRSNADPDAYHRILAGTSMAAPHVAGVIALMLQYDPDLEALDVPQILRNAARLDELTGILVAGNPEWGFGKVDARTATGFYRLTIMNSGLPKNLPIPIAVDGNRTVTMESDSWTYLYFLKGKSHEISLTPQLKTETGTVYELSQLSGPSSFTINGSTIKTLSYSQAEYSLNETASMALVAILVVAFAAFALFVFRRFPRIQMA